MITSSIKSLFLEVAELKAAVTIEVSDEETFPGADVKYLLEKLTEKIEHLEGTLNKLSRIGVLG